MQVFVFEFVPVLVFVLSARAGSEDKDAGTCERDAD